MSVRHLFGDADIIEHALNTLQTFRNENVVELLSMG